MQRLEMPDSHLYAQDAGFFLLFILAIVVLSIIFSKD